MERLRRDEAGRGGVGTGVSGSPPEMQQAIARGSVLSLDSDLDFSWGNIGLSNPCMKDGMTSVYAILGAKAALEMSREERLKGTACKPLQIFIHNARFVLSDDVLGVPIDEVEVVLCPQTAEVILKRFRQPDVVCDVKSNGEMEWFGGHVSPEGQALSVNAEGSLTLRPDLDARHYEAETLCVYLLAKKLCPALTPARCQPDATVTPSLALAASKSGRVLIVSNDNDCPMSSLLSIGLAGQGVVHDIGDKYICIDRLHFALRRRNISPIELCLVFGVGGSDITPVTHGVTQSVYCKSFLENASILKRLSTNPAATAATTSFFAWFEALTTLAFASSCQTVGARFAPGRVPLRIAAFHAYVSRYVAESSKARSGLNQLPERQDIVLQAKRSLALLRYWTRASELICDESSLGPFDETTGYNNDTGGPLFEPVGAAKRRNKVLNDEATGCGCKTAA